MGLDIYFHKGKKSAYKKYLDESAKFENKEIEERPDFESMVPECGYFRKVNFLVKFFNYEDNCSLKEISRCELETLSDACDNVLNGAPADEELPTEGGFFFGSTDYDDYYYSDVKEVKEWVDELLQSLADDDVVFMYCWW